MRRGASVPHVLIVAFRDALLEVFIDRSQLQQ